MQDENQIIKKINILVLEVLSENADSQSIQLQYSQFAGSIGYQHEGWIMKSGQAYFKPTLTKGRESEPCIDEERSQHEGIFIRS